MANVSGRFAIKALACAISAVSSLVNADTSALESAKATEDPGAMELEKVVITGALSRYGATKSDIPIVETARSVSVIDEKTFQDLGAISLDDTLSYTSGVLGDTFGFSTRGDFPTVRGFDAAEYRDGQQVLFGSYNNTRSEVYFLEQVEVLKGPASVLYGKGTPGGIVNAISKLAGDGKQNEIVLDLGTDSRQQLSADLNTQLVDGLYARAVGFYRNSGTQIDHVDDDAIGFMPSITFVNDTSLITGMVEYIDRESDTSHQFLPIRATGCLSRQVEISPSFLCQGVSGEELDASTYLGNPEFNRYNSTSLLISLLGSHQINDYLEIEGVIRHKDAEVDYRQAWVDFTLPGQRIDENGNGSRTYYLSDASSEQLAADVRLRADVQTGTLEHQIVAGIAYQDVETDNDLTYLTGQDVINVFNPQNNGIPFAFQSGEALFDGVPVAFQDYGVYVSNQIKLDKWKFNLGIRYDRVEASGTDAGAPYSQEDDAVSTSLAVLYNFDSGLSPYMSYAESFEPVLGTVDTDDDPQTPGIPAKPREGRQYELGFKYQPQGTSTYLTLALFDIEESNLPNPSSLTGAGVSESQLAGVGSSQGVEFETFFAFSEFDWKTSITLMDTEDANGFTFASIPEKQVSSWLNFDPKDGILADFRSGVGVRHVGQNEGNVVGIKVVTDAYTAFDAMLGYEINDWLFQVNARNLANKRYYSTCLARGDCYPGEERSVVAKVAYRF